METGLDHHHLQLVNNGDFLAYSDIDTSDFVSWQALLLETMEDTNHDLGISQMSYLERDWTKGDVYKIFNVRKPSDDDGQQYWAGWMVLRKIPATIQLTKEWVEAARDYHLLSDEESIEPNSKTFSDNRHDQSLLSMLLRFKYKEPDKQIFPWSCFIKWKVVTMNLSLDTNKTMVQ